MLWLLPVVAFTETRPLEQLRELTPRLQINRPVHPLWRFVGYTITPLNDPTSQAYLAAAEAQKPQPPQMVYGVAYDIQMYFESRGHHAYTPQVQMTFASSIGRDETPLVDVAPKDTAPFFPGEVHVADVRFRFLPQYDVHQTYGYTEPEAFNTAVVFPATDDEPEQTLRLGAVAMLPLVNVDGAVNLNVGRDTKVRSSRNYLADVTFPDGVPVDHQQNEPQRERELIEGLRPDYRNDFYFWSTGEYQEDTRRMRLELRERRTLDRLLIDTWRPSADVFINDVIVRVGDNPTTLREVTRWPNEGLWDEEGRYRIVLSLGGISGKLIEVEFRREATSRRMGLYGFSLWGR